LQLFSFGGVLFNDNFSFTPSTYKPPWSPMTTSKVPASMVSLAARQVEGHHIPEEGAGLDSAFSARRT
jgi:hypothetical protein